MFYISNGKQLNLHSVSFDIVGGAFDTFLVYFVLGLVNYKVTT